MVTGEYNADKLPSRADGEQPNALRAAAAARTTLADIKRIIQRSRSILSETGRIIEQLDSTLGGDTSRSTGRAIEEQSRPSDIYDQLNKLFERRPDEAARSPRDQSGITDRDNGADSRTRISEDKYRKKGMEL